MADRLMNGMLVVALVGFVALASWFFMTPPVSQIFQCVGGCVDLQPAPPPAFDLSAVKAHFDAECAAPSDKVDLFCQQVEIDDMRGEDDHLYVRTTLHGQDHDRAVAICDQVASAHLDDEGRDLGYAIVSIRKQSGGPHFQDASDVACAV